MRCFRTALFLGLSAAYAAGLLLSLRPAPARPDPPAPIASPRRLLTMQCAFEKGEGRRILLKLTGQAQLPEGTILSLRLSRLQEHHHFGKLESTAIAAGLGSAAIEDERFGFEERVTAPGIYRAVVTLNEGLQEPSIAVTIPLRQRRWEFEYVVWGDDLLPRLQDERERVETLIGDVRGMVDWIRVAAVSQAQWSLDGPQVLYEALRLQALVDFLAESRALYPATHETLAGVLRLMIDATSHFFWTPDGSFGGAYDPTTATWKTTPDGRPFSFPRMSEDLDGLYGILRREHDLWKVKEARRVYRDDAGLSAARARHPEIRARLEKMERSLDRIDAGLRGESHELPRQAQLPPPAQFVQTVTRYERLKEARALLEQADQLWDQIDDRKSPSLYRRLLQDYPETLDSLHARVRVGNRAHAESD